MRAPLYQTGVHILCLTFGRYWQICNDLTEIPYRVISQPLVLCTLLSHLCQVVTFHCSPWSFFSVFNPVNQFASLHCITCRLLLRSIYWFFPFLLVALIVLYIVPHLYLVYFVGYNGLLPAPLCSTRLFMKSVLPCVVLWMKFLLLLTVFL